jgi:hypothetical protein
MPNDRPKRLHSMNLSNSSCRLFVIVFFRSEQSVVLVVISVKSNGFMNSFYWLSWIIVMIFSSLAYPIVVRVISSVQYQLIVCVVVYCYCWQLVTIFSCRAYFLKLLFSHLSNSYPMFFAEVLSLYNHHSCL